MPSIEGCEAARRPRRRLRWSNRRERQTSCLVALLTGTLFSARPARAQLGQGRLQNDFGDLMRVMSDLIAQIGAKSRGQVLDFFNRVELFNVESEIDRLVGSPWELSDSTSYKLSLAPLHLAYPVFDQQVQQMTRLDDIRSRRIQDLTVDSLGLIPVNLDLLNGEQSGGQIANSILHYFNAREFLDLGVFLLAQQPYFPQTDDEWAIRKHQLAGHQGALALTVAGLGALFEVGALNDSGTLRRCAIPACSVGWYGGFSHLGYHFQPILRGGLMARLPALEMSAGLLEQVRASSGEPSSVFEMAMRESWLNRFTSVSGWDSFFEAAVRRVLSADAAYVGESLTTRGGLFIKRERPFKWRYIVLRGSTEVESNLTGSLRYVMGLGIDYTRTGLSAVVQSSRTNFNHNGAEIPETHTALFVAGTMESPEEYYVEAMNVRARLLREQWELLIASELEKQEVEAQIRVLAGREGPARLAPLFEAERAALAASEDHRARIAILLGDYLEGRRIAYSLKQWTRSQDDLQGPLDGEVLENISRAVVQRLGELAAFLQGGEARLSILRERYSSAVEQLQAAASPRARALATSEMQAIDAVWRRESEPISEALRLYNHYAASIHRVSGLAGGLMPVWLLEPLSPRTARKLTALVAQPLQ
jgi:hypothetical protein